MDVEDARYRKSEERIQNALAELLSAKSLVDVSVSELSRKANVSRATFYSHYNNVSDAFDQLVARSHGEASREMRDSFLL